jgi:hypothetical protein
VEAGESRRSKGRDGLRRTGHRQLSFAFAASPQGGGEGGTSDASGGRAFLLHTAKPKKTARTVACAVDTSRLLEEVASAANLAQALLKVIRNEGAPGVDGQTVVEAQQNAAPLLAALRHALLTGRYRPGDVRRVWLPKPGGGQRGLGIPNVVDRVVQQAVLQVLEPIFEPTPAFARAGSSTPAVMASARIAAPTPRSPRQRNILRPDIKRWWTLTCRNFSTGSIISACSTGSPSASPIGGFWPWCATC